MDSPLSIISLILSALSLLVALQVYSVFHRRIVQKKQVMLVLELISNFQKCQYSIMRKRHSENKQDFVNIMYGNIFTLADKRIGKKTIESARLEINELPVCFTQELLDIIQVTDLISNPILPNKIARNLREIFSNKITYSKRTESDCDYILVDKLPIRDAKEREENGFRPSSGYIFFLEPKFGDFLSTIDDTRIAINKWLKKIGIKDLNVEWNR